MFPTRGRIVFVLLDSGDVVPAIVRQVRVVGTSQFPLVDVTAFPDTGPDAVRLHGVPFAPAEDQRKGSWHWPPRVA